MIVELSLDDWNKVLAILAQAPWATVNPLIMTIGEQLRGQAPSSVPAPPRPNGPVDPVSEERSKQ